MNPLIKSNLCLQWAKCCAVLHKIENNLPKKVFRADFIAKMCLQMKFFNLLDYSTVSIPASIIFCRNLERKNSSYK